jgi:hypothetical protein
MKITIFSSAKKVDENKLIFSSALVADENTGCSIFVGQVADENTGI